MSARRYIPCIKHPYRPAVNVIKGLPYCRSCEQDYKEKQNERYGAFAKADKKGRK